VILLVAMLSVAGLVILALLVTVVAVAREMFRLSQ
jgi:hypothetical protein